MSSFARHKELKAFTLLELLVGMILSGIVLAATFTAYRVVTRQYETYRDKSKSITEVSLFVAQLESDFENATTITLASENRIHLQFEKRMLEYRFSEKYVLRNDFMRTDTFNVSVAQTEAFRQSGKINSESAEIDELRLRINYEGETEEKIYIKTKDPKTEIDKIDAELD
jgi:prepilin-type N-terminal cleavage/methylation domain-containing protein